ncbi:MAG TPA: helix-turn-helix domain-containing protein [Dermatophilaceae bacterium]|nr:helix-turn-helix domain-containing protein [Dermatophilaceae bacterium]
MNNTRRLGPAHFREPELDGTRVTVLAHLARRRRPVTVAALSERMTAHSNTIRGHLDALAQAGLVESAPLPVSGRGRPTRGYTATDSGRSALRRRARQSDSTLGAEYAALAVAFTEHLAARPDAGATARAVGRAWGERLAAQPRGIPDAEPTALLGELGFGPVADPAAGPRAVQLRTCPLLDVAREHPEVVCGVHLGLVDALLERGERQRAAVDRGAADGRAGGGAAREPGVDSGGREPGAVELEPFAGPGYCRLRW